MTQSPPGWYPDPAGTQPGAPSLVRWWDGTQWTPHTSPVSAGPAQGIYGGKATTTPDGQPLAGWWHRVGAYVIDYVVLLVLAVLAGWPFVRRIVTVYIDYVHAAIRASESGGQPPPSTDLITGLIGPLLAYGAIAIAVSFLYTVVFLRTLQATPGKLLTGLRVRLRDQPGRLTWRAILLRWLVQNVSLIVGVVPYVGTFGGLFGLLDGLWPLWDDKRQALHDKAAATNVVRR